MLSIYQESLSLKAAYAARQLEYQMKLAPGILDRIIRLAIALHDLGKMDYRWQKWAHEWQRRIGRPVADDYMAAHTDYNPDDFFHQVVIFSFHLRAGNYKYALPSQQYAIDDEERSKWYQAFMESILYTFIEPNGAMRGTQNPHIVEFEGAVVTTSQAMPAPALSPLNQNYREELARVAQGLESLKSGAIAIRRINSMGKFVEIMKGLIKDTEPYKVSQ